MKRFAGRDSHLGISPRSAFRERVPGAFELISRGSRLKSFPAKQYCGPGHQGQQSQSCYGNQGCSGGSGLCPPSEGYAGDQGCSGGLGDSTKPQCSGSKGCSEFNACVEETRPEGTIPSYSIGEAIDDANSSVSLEYVHCPGCKMRLSRSLSFENVKNHIDSCAPEFFSKSESSSIRVFHVTWLIMQARYRMIETYKSRNSGKLPGHRQYEHRIIASPVAGGERLSTGSSAESSPKSTNPTSIASKSGVSMTLVDASEQKRQQYHMCKTGCHSCHKNTGWLRVCGRCHELFHVECDRMDIVTPDHRILVNDPLCFSCATRSGAMYMPSKSMMQKHWTNVINVMETRRPESISGDGMHSKFV